MEFSWAAPCVFQLVVRQNGHDVEYATGNLRACPDVVKLAVAQDTCVSVYACECLKAVPYVFEYVVPTLQSGAVRFLFQIRSPPPSSGHPSR